MNRLLIISPHLDDGVLSCGARIAMETARGTSVLVASCFTNSGDGAPSSAQEHYRQRKTDDRAATQALGAGLLHLEFTDAPFRDPRYHNFHTILFHHRTPADEKPLMLSLGEALKDLAARWRPDEILLPLGVGGHIDHHLVWEGSKILWDTSYRLSYYEELPYALLPGWSAVRRREIGGRAGSSVEIANEKPVKMGLGQNPYPFVCNYLNSADDIQRSTRQYDKEFAALQASDVIAREWIFEDRVLMHTLLEFEGHYLNRKCAAITQYSTEWPVLFGGAADRIPDMLRQFSTAGEYTETCWRLKTNQ